MPSPRGYAHRFSLRAVPLGPPSPTGDLLCDTCVREVYGDRLRYARVLTTDESEQAVDMDDEAYDRYLAEARCDRCGALRHP